MEAALDTGGKGWRTQLSLYPRPRWHLARNGVTTSGSGAGEEMPTSEPAGRVPLGWTEIDCWKSGSKGPLSRFGQTLGPPQSFIHSTHT